MLFPIIEPDMSITMTISLGDVEACIYQIRRRQSYKSVPVESLTGMMLPGYMRKIPKLKLRNIYTFPHKKTLVNHKKNC